MLKFQHKNERDTFSPFSFVLLNPLWKNIWQKICKFIDGEVGSKHTICGRLICYYLISFLSLTGNGTEASAGKPAAQVYRSNSLIYQVTLVNISCEFTDSYVIDWTVYSPWYGPHSKHSVSTGNFQSENGTLRIPCCILSYGDLAVNVTVTIVGHRLIEGLFSLTKLLFAHINDTDLVASLVGNSANNSYAYNTVVSFILIIFGLLGKQNRPFI